MISVKRKCPKCNYEQPVNPYYDDWFCIKCKTHWIFEIPEKINNVKKKKIK